MRGRITVYSGNEALGRKLLQAALESDPENDEIKLALKNIKLSTELKVKASELFKNAKYEAAID